MIIVKRNGVLRGRVARFARGGLYPVISSEFCAGRSPLEVFELAAKGGASVIQVREKNMPDDELFKLVRQCRPVADRCGVLLIVDDRAEVAARAGADGVHIGQDDMSVSNVRAIDPELMIGKSTHNLDELLAAQEEGTDYLNIGPIYPTQTKSVSYPAVGVDELKRLIPSVKIPFSVMGGIKLRHLPELISAGAMRIAMVTEVTQAPDVTAKVRELEALFA